MALGTAQFVEVDSIRPDAGNRDINRGVAPGGTSYFTFSLTQPQINSILNNFGSRVALQVEMQFGTGLNAVRVMINDNVGSSGEIIHYTFESGTDVTNPGFTVTPTDTGMAIPISTGAITPTGTIAEGDLAVWNADGTQLSAQRFEQLLNNHNILIETDIPPLAADLQGDTEYTFRIYTRDFQSENTVVAANFELLNVAGPARADAGHADNPTQIGPNAAQIFRVSWTADSIRQYITNQTAAGSTLTRPAVIVPGISPDQFSPLLASHDVGLGEILTPEQERVVNASTSTGVQPVIATTQKEGGFLERTVGGVVEDSGADSQTTLGLARNYELFSPPSPNAGQSAEWIANFGANQWTIEFDENSGIDFSNTQVGDTFVLTIHADSIDRQDGNTPAGYLPMGRYYVYAIAPSSGPNVVTVSSATVREIYLDGTVGNHIGHLATVGASGFSIPFADNSIQITRASDNLERQFSTTNNTTEIGFSDRGLRVNEALVVNGTQQTSETLASNIGTPITGTYPAFWPLRNNNYLLDVTGADFTSIPTGSPFRISVTEASTQGFMPVGDYIAYRVNAPLATTIEFASDRVFPIEANNRLGARLLLNFSLNWPANAYTFSTVDVAPEFSVQLVDNTDYDFRPDGLYLNGTHIAHGGDSVTATGDAAARGPGDIAVFANDPAQIRGQTFESLLATNFIMVDSDMPLTAAEVRGGTDYTFRVYTRQVQSDADTITNASFLIRIGPSDIPVMATTLTGPSRISPFSADRFVVQFNDADEITRLNGLGNALISPVLVLPTGGELVACLLYTSPSPRDS